MKKGRICPTSLEGLEHFSHIWIIFIFHQNTNSTNHEGSTRGVISKIAPPLLGGKKVGVFATRTPHRLNPIGLSIVSLHGINFKTMTLDISGHDVIDGTPILDIKPYVPYDTPSDSIRFPDWISEEAKTTCRITFSKMALKNITDILLFHQLEFYKTENEIIEIIKQTLLLDVRSVHQGRGGGRSGGVGVEYHCRIDKLNVQFHVCDMEIDVGEIEFIIC